MYIKKTLTLFFSICLMLPTLIMAQPATNWWNQSVFYEIFVRSYFDSNADGIGDFNGLTSKLNYLNDGDSNTPGAQRAKSRTP